MTCAGSYRRGVGARDGKLYLFEGDRRGRGGVWVLRGWPAPMAWRKTSAEPTWRHGRPDLPLEAGALARRFLPASWMESEERDKPRCADRPAERQLELPFVQAAELVRARGLDQIRGFLGGIPPRALSLIQGSGTRHWHLLALAARCPGAVDLLEGAPAIAWCLASSWVFRERPVQRPLRSARALLCRRQREILRSLGFPGTESCAKLMRRIPAAHLELRRLLNLRAALHDVEMAKRLAHAAVLNAGVLDLACHPRLFRYVTPQLLAEVAAHPRERQGSPTARALHAILKISSEIGVPPPPRPFRRREAVLECVRDLCRARGDVRHRELLRLRFPEPPMPGMDGIVPILDPIGMFAEGEAQMNCVSNLIPAVAEGRSFVYRVTYPERATLSLTRRRNTWILDELLARCNRDVMLQTQAWIHEWLGTPTANPTAEETCPF
jgi:hypothetical protein